MMFPLARNKSIDSYISDNEITIYGFDPYKAVFVILLGVPLLGIVFMVLWTANRLPCFSPMRMKKALGEYLKSALDLVLTGIWEGVDSDT